MNKAGLSNSGEMTIVRLDRREYDVQDELTGTVELSNPQRKEISSITLELTTWRHLTLPRSGRTSVEQLSRQSLELFPNLAADRDRRYGHDEKILRTNALFAYTFGAIEKHPTTDFLDNARIKHYLTCYVYKKSGLLSRERVIEKNQFQILINSSTIEVDAMYPDRLFSYLQSKSNSANSPIYDLRARCNTHLMPGLPFLVELDIVATEVEINSVQLSLHQITRVSVGSDEEDLGRPTSRYVHEVTWPPVRDEGHFRQKDSARTVAHGRRSWLIEWMCPTPDARVKLPFEDTIYCTTDEGAVQRGLSLKVEIELRNSPTKLAAVIHNLEYRSKWIDSRRDQTQSLRRVRSIFMGPSPAASLRSETRQGLPEDSRRSSIVSARSANNHQSAAIPQLSSGYHNGGYILGSRHSPLVSPTYPTPRHHNDYFNANSVPPSQRPSSAPLGTSHSPRLTHGAYSPGSVQLFSRADSVRSNNSSRTAFSQTQRGHPAEAPGSNGQSDRITLPPAAVRSSMSSAFEAMNIRHSATSQNSPTRRQFDDIPRVYEEPPPPPQLPLPAAPIFGTGGALPFALNLPITPVRDGQTPVENVMPGSPKLKKPTRLSRPAVILGVSQDTIQTQESFASASSLVSKQSLDHGPSRITSPIGRPQEDTQPRLMDRDSGFSDTSFAPGSPLARIGPAINSMGFAARRESPRTSDTNGFAKPPAADDGGIVMLG